MTADVAPEDANGRIGRTLSGRTVYSLSTSAAVPRATAAATRGIAAAVVATAGAPAAGAAATTPLARLVVIAPRIALVARRRQHFLAVARAIRTVGAISASVALTARALTALGAGPVVAGTTVLIASTAAVLFGLAEIHPGCPGAQRGTA